MQGASTINGSTSSSHQKPPHYASLDRVSHYGWVKSLQETYAKAKSSSTLVKRGAEYLEQTGSSVAEGRLVNGVAYYGQPLFVFADTVASSQLALLETVAGYGHSVLEDRVLLPLKNTANNVKALPLVALDKVEETLDGYLPNDAKLQGKGKGKQEARLAQFSLFRVWLIVAALLRIVLTRLGFDYDARIKELQSTPIYVDSLNYLRSNDPAARQQFIETARRFVWDIRKSLRSGFIYVARFIVQTTIVQPVLRIYSLIFAIWNYVLNRFLLKGPFARNLAKPHSNGNVEHVSSGAAS